MDKRNIFGNSVTFNKFPKTFPLNYFLPFLFIIRTDVLTLIGAIVNNFYSFNLPEFLVMKLMALSLLATTNIATLPIVKSSLCTS